MKSSPRPADDELDRLVGVGITRQQVEPGDDCLDFEVLASYADGGLSVQERAAAEAHLANCRECRRALALQVESDPAGAVTPVVSTPAAAASATVVTSAKTWLPLAAAIVAATGLWFAFGPSRPSRQDGTQSIASEPARLSARHEAPPAPAAAPAPAAPAPAAPASSADARARREGSLSAAASARPRVEAETDRVAKTSAPAPAAAPSAAPPPPPPQAALVDAVAAPKSGVVGREAQVAVAGQAQGAQAASAPQAPAQTATANQNAANRNAANQNAASQQGYVVNQQTGPMGNLNVAPPAARADERRQADAKKAEANEKSAGGPSSVKSADGSAKVTAEEPKSLARAKAAPESPAGTAPAEAESTKSDDPAFRSRIASASGGSATASDSAAGRGVTAGTAAGARAGDTGTREGVINETITIVTSAPATMPVLRSVDGTRWWRIRAPGTIEGSTDRGTTWTVEYSDPSAHLLRGTAAKKGGAWMIGARGLVLRTRPNGGWERVKEPTTRDLVTLIAIDHLIATVTDEQDRTYRTTDGGASWR